MAEDLLDQQEEQETTEKAKKSSSSKKSTRKSSSKKSKKETDNSVDSQEQLPAVIDDISSVFEDKLENIESQIQKIADKQASGVSAEFSALMDGYVNKANESQEFKVKHDHLESVHDDLKAEFRTVKEDNKKLKLDIEDAREALRLSEADLQRTKTNSETAKTSFEEQIANLIDERERLKTKVKQLSDSGEKLQQEYNDLKTELLDYKYKSKQLEQEKQVEIETHKRSVRETNKIMEELKEKLDLRTREVEYKDALLNQLIKQVSADETMLEAGDELDYNTKFQANAMPEAPRQIANPSIDPMASNSIQNQAAPFIQEGGFQARPKPDVSFDDNDDDSNSGLSWGAFKK